MQGCLASQRAGRPTGLPASAARAPRRAQRARALRSSNTTVCSASAQEPERKNVVVVGGGWAGFGAAKHLAEQGYAVRLLDAAPNPGGLSTGWRSPGGRALEAGFKGFWWQYANIFALVRQLGIEKDLFTPFLPSAFYNRRGLVTQAPVFSQQQRLPAVLGQFAYTFNLFPGLPLADRASIIPFLYSAIDLHSTPGSYERYDSLSAHDLFKMFGVTKRAYEEFLKPTLLVGLFAPPEELSAAVVIETLYFYALGHQNDFDVCWCRGPVAERIFAPLVSAIEAAGGLVEGGRRVTGLRTDESGNVTGVVASTSAGTAAAGDEEVYDADAVVFAVSVAGMQRIVAGTPALAGRPEFRGLMNLGSIDCVATRLWLDRRLPTAFPVNVCAGFDADVGSTYFNLNELQDEYRDAPGTVLAADFYHANELLPLSDDQIVAKVLSNVSTCEPAFGAAKVEDAAVLRFPRAVTHFSPGSARWRPQQASSLGNVFLAGDWVAGVDHGANGLSQERAWVTGLSAANLVVQRFGRGAPAAILPVEADEAHIALAKQVNSGLKNAALAAGLRSPLL